MADSFLFNIAESVLEKIATITAEEISMARGVRDELSKLHNTVSNVKAVLLDAEEKQLTSHEIVTWLGQLKDLLSEAEDVFDEFQYEAFRKQVVNTRGGIIKKVRRFFSSSNPIAFRLKMGHKLKEIREAFDEVAANKAKFHLNIHHVPNTTPFVASEREMTNSFVHASDIIGRDRERDNIVNSLMDSSQGSNENLPVVSVVGLGGLGKTALVKMIFNDSMIVEHFEMRVWVCLGDLKEFSINKVMEKIVKSIPGEKKVDSDTEQLQCCLHDSLEDKKFLLVLDDVWVVDRPKWLELKRMLMCGLRGSTVFVTTRDSSIASHMGSIFTQNLKGLPFAECVSLFKKFAFNEGKDERNLMEIGDAIVENCKGVPLALKTLGCMLFSKTNIGDWKCVRVSEIWQLEQNKDDILPALKLSYDQLPFVLKQCFVCCSIFPKDYNFSIIVLVRQWSEYGLLQSPIKTKKQDEIGQQYIKELGARGFFQDFEGHVSTVSFFKMHDLVHDLALFLAKNEFRNMSVGRQQQDIYKRIKHVSFFREEGMVGEEVPKLFLRKYSSFRGVMPTIWCMCFDGEGEGDGMGELLKTCISKLKHMRVLELNSRTDLEQLPTSIGTLKHLRSLNLKGCMRLKRLPNSITKLYNLQTLFLGDCEELEELPKDLGDLINLRALSIKNMKSLSSVTANGIKSLCSLQYLSLTGCPNLEYIFEWEEEEDDDEARQQLTSLQTLFIIECESLMFLFRFRPSTSAPRKRSRFPSLETIAIADCPNFDLPSTYNEEISLPCRKSLMLEEMPQMESLPQWICPPTLEYLECSVLPNLTSLPEWLRNLTSLRQLRIRNCPNLLCLPYCPLP